jgi:hypothetical protein
MANLRALTEALFFGSLAAVSAMFACSGPVPYLGPGDAGGGAALSDAPASIDAPSPVREASANVDLDGASYPLSRCATGQDIFYLDVEGPAGPLQQGEITKTNSGTSWFVSLQPELNVMLAGPTGPVGSIQVWTPDSSPAVPGTYPQGPTAKGTSIAVVVVEEPCHLSSGTLTVLDLQYDWPDGSTSGDVTSLLMSFDLMCGNDSLRGCVRYSQ